MTWTIQQKMLGKFTIKKKNLCSIRIIKHIRINSIYIKEIAINIKTMKKNYVDSTELSSHKIIPPKQKSQNFYSS